MIHFVKRSVIVAWILTSGKFLSFPANPISLITYKQTELQDNLVAEHFFLKITYCNLVASIY